MATEMKVFRITVETFSGNPPDISFLMADNINEALEVAQKELLQPGKEYIQIEGPVKSVMIPEKWRKKIYG